MKRDPSRASTRFTPKYSTGLALVVALVAPACGASAAQISAVTSLTGTASAGQSVYSSQCQSCHGTNGRSGSAGRNIVQVAQSNTNAAVGVILLGDGTMPSFDNTLTDQQIADVIAYVKTL
ncbi:MAG: cytochrome c [Myxococcales bacterium]|nr:cytochrome c [Myxococcales bacterium]